VTLLDDVDGYLAELNATEVYYLALVSRERLTTGSQKNRYGLLTVISIPWSDGDWHLNRQTGDSQTKSRPTGRFHSPTQLRWH
jgi:hypothetical protein